MTTKARATSLAIGALSVLALQVEVADAASPRWRPPAKALETMRAEKIPGVFWFQGYGNKHVSISHQFGQASVIKALKRFYCAQVPNLNGRGKGRSEDEVKVAQHFGIGRTEGILVVCAWDGYEITRYSDVVETRHFVPIVQHWFKQHRKRLSETKKAERSLRKARESIEKGVIPKAILKLQHILKKSSDVISESVREEAGELRSELVTRAEKTLLEAKAEAEQGRGDAAKEKAEQVLKAYGKLEEVAKRARAFLGELER